jgi:GrpB-like predicted nucleotidyltransferase (UPF0157 family)
MDWLVDVGLGLDNDTLRLSRTTPEWVEAGARLRRDVADRLAGLAVAVEQIGSSSVNGLLAKPIIDLAIGLTADQDFMPVREQLESAEWIYRGDAGGQGGHVFILESVPSRRVAHAHVVEHLGEQWRNYTRLRDLLRRSPEARHRYEDVKVQLANSVGNDRVLYTDGKTEIVSSLLEEA